MSQLVDSDNSLEDIPQDQLELARMSRTNKVNSDLYMQLLQRQQQTEIALATTTSNIEVIDPAILSESPISPNRPKLFMIASLAGLLGGIGCTFLLDYFDQTIRDVEGVREYLDLPVLATIPRIDLAHQAAAGSVNQLALTLAPKSPAVEAFRAYLQDEHGTIANLNAAWGTSYPSFDDIDTPPLMIRALIITKDADDRDVYTAFLPVKRLPGAPTTPLTYEFEKCRKDLYGEYFYDCHQAIKRGDPCYPTASSTSGGIMNEILINSHDDLNMMRRGVDMFGKHPSGGYGWGDSPYMYGLNRYFNKTLVALEYYGWAQQVIGDEFWGKFEVAPGTSTSRVFNAARRDTWHEYSWDRRMLLFYWAQKLVEMKIPPGGSPSDGFTEYTSPLVRPWAGFVAAVKRRVLRTHDVMTNVPIVQPRIAVIHPGVSIINAFPTDGCGSITNDVMDRLIAMQYHFGIVPEELVLNSPGDPDGYDSLDNYDVVILPYVQYFDDGFAAKLMNWVSNGGTLIALGPFGLYDKYGHAITDAATLAYPGATFTYPPPADFPLSWLWQSSGGSPPISGSYDSRSYGSGTVLLTLDGRALYRPGLGEWALTKVTTRPPGSDIVDPGGYSAAQQAFYDTLAAATQRRAWVTSGNVELVARQDSTGQGPLYISLLNWDYNSTLDTDLVVDGEYTNISDLSISGGFPALGTINSGQTTVPIRIGPGEGLMLRFEE